MFQTEADSKRQSEVAKLLEEGWTCKIHGFGALSPIDWWMEKNRQFVAVLELKVRSHSVDKFPTVFLSLRKWLTLALAQSGMGVTGLYVVKFTDALRWIDIADVHTESATIAIGGHNNLRAKNDREPIIHVPIELMKEIRLEENTNGSV